MTWTQKRIVFFERYCLFYLTAMSQGIRLMPYCFFRSRPDQYDAYKKGLSKIDGISKDSNHYLWQAMDAVIVNDDESLCWDGNDPRYKTLENIACAVGLKTGLRYKDANHTEMPDQ